MIRNIVQCLLFFLSVNVGSEATDGQQCNTTCSCSEIFLKVLFVINKNCAIQNIKNSLLYKRA